MSNFNITGYDSAPADERSDLAREMSNHVSNLRRTRADMLGTDDEEHYRECHRAAGYIEELESYLDEEREKNEKQVRMTMDLQVENERLTAVYEAVKNFNDTTSLDNIYVRSAKLYKALAAVEEKTEDHRLDEAITEYYTDLRGKDDVQ